MSMRPCNSTPSTSKTNASSRRGVVDARHRPPQRRRAPVGDQAADQLRRSPARVRVADAPASVGPLELEVDGVAQLERVETAALGDRPLRLRAGPARAGRSSGSRTGDTARARCRRAAAAAPAARPGIAASAGSASTVRPPSAKSSSCSPTGIAVTGAGMAVAPFAGSSSGSAGRSTRTRRRASPTSTSPSESRSTPSTSQRCAIVVSSPGSNAPATIRCRRARVSGHVLQPARLLALRGPSAAATSSSRARAASTRRRGRRRAARPAARASTRMSRVARAIRSRPVSTSATTSNSSPLAACIVISTTACSSSSAVAASPSRVCSAACSSQKPTNASRSGPRRAS